MRLPLMYELFTNEVLSTLERVTKLSVTFESRTLLWLIVLFTIVEFETRLLRKVELIIRLELIVVLDDVALARLELNTDVLCTDPPMTTELFMTLPNTTPSPVVLFAMMLRFIRLPLIVELYAVALSSMLSSTALV